MTASYSKTKMEVVASPRRLAILRAIRRSGPMSMSDLAREIGVTGGGVTQHVASLESHGIVRKDQGMHRTMVSIVPGSLDSILDELRWLAS